MNRKVHFLLWTSATHQKTLCDQLNAAARGRWWVRLFHRDARARRAITRPEMPEKAFFSSWNICSIGDKKAELGMFLSEEKVAVLALQEVCCSVDDRRLSLHGYQSVIGGVDASRKGARGVSLLIRRDLVAAELGEPDGNLAWAKVLLGPKFWLFASVYIPQKLHHRERERVLERVHSDLLRLTSRFAAYPLVLAGDFNSSLIEVERWLKSLRPRLDLRLLPFRGSPVTWYRRNWTRSTAIDHMVVNGAAFAALCHCVVNRTWDTSDHFTILTKVETS